MVYTNLKNYEQLLQKINAESVTISIGLTTLTCLVAVFIYLNIISIFH
jgi:hypothetical protein